MAVEFYLDLFTPLDCFSTNIFTPNKIKIHHNNNLIDKLNPKYEDDSKSITQP